MKEKSDLELIRILWDYMKMNDKLEKCDCIIGLGCEDTNVAKTVVKLYKEGYADKIIFAGGYGKVTSTLWSMPEAEKFKEIAVSLGIPEDVIYTETKSTNTGHNLSYSKNLIEREKLDVKTCLIVCKPYSEKRTYATFGIFMKGYRGIFTSEDIALEDYIEREGYSFVSGLVGEIQRMRLYAKPEIGWHIPVEVPDDVWEAHLELARRGYDEFIFSENADKNEVLKAKTKIEDTIAERGLDEEN